MRELENYFCTPSVLIKWANSKSVNLFTQNYPNTMNNVIEDIFPKLYLDNGEDEFWRNEKLSDWAERIFKEFYKRIGQPLDMREGNFHELISLLEPNEIHPEITEKLDALYEVLK